MAQKWPVTPATTLTSWVYQEPEVRELLWNKLQEAMPKAEVANLSQWLLYESRYSGNISQTKYT